MRCLFVISLACVFMSLFAILGLSAMTLAPRPGGEISRARLMVAAGAFCAAWLGLAIWARARPREDGKPLPPQWLRRVLAAAGVVYAGSVLFFLIG